MTRISDKTFAGKKIIKSLKQAVRFAKGDKSQGTLYVWRRCGCCDKRFTAPEGAEPVFCKKCEGISDQAQVRD